MKKRTFVEKIFDASVGSIVFKKPDIVLTHDNTSSIIKTFEKMNGDTVADPNQMLVVLDHNAPPTTSALANNYQAIRDFVKKQGVKRFHDVGQGICHQIMAKHARPKNIIVGSDSHTCTAGAFNAFAAGIDRTEAAGLWRQGETWFRVPESIKIILHGEFPQGVYAKDLSLWIIGMIGSSGADYKSIEYHGDGVASLAIADRMTLANLASEMGAKNAVFPADKILRDYYGEDVEGIWADEGAEYSRVIEINLGDLFPVVAVPHHVDNVKSLFAVKGTKVHQALLGTCTNGRIEDMREAAKVLEGKQLPEGFQMLVVPASKEISLQMIKEGLTEIFMNAGATVLATSCGPCLGTGQGIPADGYNVISTANRNFKGRMGNKESFVYLASPAAVATSALHGEITDPRENPTEDTFPYSIEQTSMVSIEDGDDRYVKQVWDYADIHNLNTDQMFAGNLTYKVSSAEPEAIMPYLFEGFDESFSKRVSENDVIIAGDNFGCGSSREHPAVGLSYAGVKAVVCKSVNRIFYRSSVNQGLPIIILPEAVDAYRHGDDVEVNLAKGVVVINGKEYGFKPLPEKLMEIFDQKGLVNFIKRK